MAEPSTSRDRQRRYTMQDVAERAGVSRTAVSLILNNRETRIPEETRRRVREIAEELGFRPSRAALQLRTHESRLIGFISDEIASGPFAGGLIAGAQAAAAGRAHSLIVMNTGTPGDVSSVDLELLEDRQVDGLVFATVMTRRVDLGAWTTPCVLLNCTTDDAARHQVLPDDVAGGAAATELLLQHGHRIIGFVSGEADSSPAQRRYEGYQQTLAAAGITIREELVRFGDWNGGSGYDLTKALLSIADPPTAIVCGNDRIALGAYEAIREAGLRVPDDVSVVGYDDQREIAAYLHPPLTTIRLPYEEMGRRAVAALLDGKTTGVDLVPCEPVIRGSVASAPSSTPRPAVTAEGEATTLSGTGDARMHPRSAATQAASVQSSSASTTATP